MSHTLTVSPNSVFTGQSITIDVGGLDVDEERPSDGEFYDFGIIRDGVTIYGYDPDDYIGINVNIGPVSITCRSAWLGGADDVLLTVRVYIFVTGLSNPEQLEQTIRLRKGGQVIPYTIDEDVAALPVSGWLPDDTKRNNLNRLLFAHGVNIIKGPNGDPHFTFLYPAPQEPEEIPSEKIYATGASETYEKPYSAVSVVEHMYTPLMDASRVTLFDNTGSDPVANKEILLNQAPIIVSTIEATEGLSLIFATENSAVVSGTGKLTGIPYTHTTRVSESLLPGGDKEKTVRVENCTMVNAINSANLLERLKAFYQPDGLIKTVKNSIVYTDQRAGKPYRLLSPFDEKISAWLTSMSINASQVFKANCEWRENYVPAGQAGLYTHADVPMQPDIQIMVSPRKGHQGDVFTAKITNHGKQAMTLTVSSVSTGQTLATYNIPAPSSTNAVTQEIQSAAGWLSSTEQIGTFIATVEVPTTHETNAVSFYLYADDINPDDIDPDDPNPPRDPEHLYVRVVPARGMPGDELTAYAGGHNGTAVSAVIKNSSLTTVASFAAVTPAGSQAEVPFSITLNANWFSSAGIEEDMFIVATSGDGQTASARFTMIPEEGDWTVPDGVTSIKVVLIGGGTGGASGYPGEAGKTTSAHTNVAEDADISGMWYGAKGGDGGNGGAGGAPGRVKTVTLEVTPGTTYHWRRGRGGAGGAASAPAAEGEEAVSNPGSAGTASTFGINGGAVYSSADADAYVPAAGVYDPINGAWYALRGSAGIRGGKGGARKIEADGYFAWTTDGEDVTGPDGTVYHGGRTGEPLTAVDDLPECPITAYGGNGAGAAVGLDREDHPEMDGKSDQEAYWEVVEDGV